jgi:hypothetical protein
LLRLSPAAEDRAPRATAPARNPATFYAAAGVEEATTDSNMLSSLPSRLRSCTAAALLAGSALVASAAPAEDPGYCDIGKLMPSSKGDFVEVNLSAPLLKFASRLARAHEPAAAELIAGLRRIRVNVVTLDNANREGVVSQMETARRQLETDGWNQVVNVREKDGGNNVNIHVRQQSEEQIDGLVVTVIDGKGQAVFVNIVGNINADRIGELAERFNIEPLRKIKVETSAKS